jgi:hypothetical protein
LTVDDYNKIRRAYRDALSIRENARAFGQSSRPGGIAGIESPQSVGASRLAGNVPATTRTITCRPSSG